MLFCDTEMKAVLPLSVLAMTKIPELKIPGEIGEQISSYDAVIAVARSTWAVLQKPSQGRDPTIGPRNLVTKV